MDIIIRNNKPSLPPRNDYVTKKQKSAILALFNGGRGGLDVPFILSKIVAFTKIVIS